MFKDLLTGFTSLVFPPACYLCRKISRSISPKDILCPACVQSFDKNIPPFCLKCSRHLSSGFPSCHNCASREIHFDFAWAALLLNEPLRHLLHQFKYHHKTALRLPFAQSMVDFIRFHHLDTGQFDFVTAIPLFHSKMRERGYNQSHLLAEEVAKTLGITLKNNLLVKRKPTKNQADLKLKERWTNIQGAFTIKHSHIIKDKNILIIDDLLTTGATASEAALCLKKNGASSVGVLTLAIVP